MISDLSVILGNQLFNPSKIKCITKFPIFMCESDDLCTQYKYHKLKILFFLAAMREYRDELKQLNISCHYHELLESSPQNYLDVLELFCKKNQVLNIHIIDTNDGVFMEKVSHFCKSLNIKLHTYDSPMFLTSNDRFEEYLSGTKRPFMKTFYEKQRKHLKLLINEDDSPIGGQWSFDEDNRKKTPKSMAFPRVPNGSNSKYIPIIKTMIQKKFNDHYGDDSVAWFPIKRAEVHEWLRCFLIDRFKLFGDYEDAIDYRSDFLFHSALSPLLNCGLITPEEIIDLIEPIQSEIPLNSYEGFLRQIIGWREFIKGIYVNFNDQQTSMNFFDHQRKLSNVWYTGNTGIDPLDDAIKQVMSLGYTHHINRLMVIGNIMLMCQIHPKEVHRWFMECFIDSDHWVMGPNVYGMSQFSDGGIFATKPYFCGSNYIRKMSHYKKGDWCVKMDALFWSFINRNKDFFSTNYRMKFMVSKIKSFSHDKLNEINRVSNKVIDDLSFRE